MDGAGRRCPRKEDEEEDEKKTKGEIDMYIMYVNVRLLCASLLVL